MKYVNGRQTGLVTFCLLQRVTEGKIQGGIEVTGRQRSRHRKLLDDLKERRGYSHLKEEALDRTIWRAGFGPVIRKTTKTKLRGLSPRANYTDRAAAAGRRS
jgi:hypothetical protein